MKNNFNTYQLPKMFAYEMAVFATGEMMKMGMVLICMAAKWESTASKRSNTTPKGWQGTSAHPPFATASPTRDEIEIGGEGKEGELVLKTLEEKVTRGIKQEKKKGR